MQCACLSFVLQELWVVFSPKKGQVKIEGRKNTVQDGPQVPSVDMSPLYKSPPVDLSGEQYGVLNQSVVGAPFISILQTMYLANGSQNISRKTVSDFLRLFDSRLRAFESAQHPC